MTSSFDRFFSSSAASMRESAIRQMGGVLAQAPDMISFAPGYPAEDAFPWTELAAISRELLDGDDGKVLQYGPTRGYKPLQDAVQELMHARGVAGDDRQIEITTGSQQGLDLIGRVLLDPGDVALLELPSYTGAILAFRNAGATLVGVAQESDGIRLDELDRVLSEQRAAGRRVKFLYLVPNFQNPTGLMLGLEKRRALLAWAADRDVLIIEDDPYRDLFFPDVASEAETRPLAADDTEGRVIYLSSFSKTLAPGLRVGWISASPAITSKLELAKQASDLCTGVLDQRLVFECCRRGVLARHVPDLRALYQRKRDAMVHGLMTALPGALSWPTPKGGFFLWVKLPPGVRASAVLDRARHHGVLFVTGNAFFVDGTGDEYVRLSFSAPSVERIHDGTRRFAAAVQETLAAVGSEAPAASARR